jgi:hypothetical protein
MHWLQRLMKILVCSVVGIVLASLLAFLYYDMTRFQPRRNDIARLIAEAQPVERHPPRKLVELLEVESGGDPSWRVTQILLFDLKVPWVTHGSLGWNATGFLWLQLVRLHLSHEERLTILCSRTFLGRRAYGYETAAQRYFQRPLERLTARELALLVVFSLRPNRWDSAVEHRVSAIEARDSLLARSAR